MLCNVLFFVHYQNSGLLNPCDQLLWIPSDELVCSSHLAVCLEFRSVSNFSVQVWVVGWVGGETALRSIVLHSECITGNVRAQSSSQYSAWLCCMQCTAIPCRGKCLAPSWVSPGGGGAGGRRQAYLITTQVTSVPPASPRVPRSSPP